jgi:hypothetical protein
MKSCGPFPIKLTQYDEIHGNMFGMGIVDMLAYYWSNRRFHTQL